MHCHGQLKGFIAYKNRLARGMKVFFMHPLRENFIEFLKVFYKKNRPRFGSLEGFGETSFICLR
jgi:hypothetical protein